MTLTWMLQAQSDLQSILEYISDDDPAAALALVEAISDSVENTLTNHHHAGRRGRVEGTREWVAHKSYVVAYRVRGEKIEILSVMHSSRLWPNSL